MACRIVDDLKARAARRRASIAYPEPDDARVREAARRVAEESVARPVLVGRPAELADGLDQVGRLELIGEGDRLERYADSYARRRGLKVPVARRLVGKPLAYAAMMVAEGDADGMVAGARHVTGIVVRTAALTIGYAEGARIPSSCFIMVVPRLRGTEDVPLLFADCAVQVEPSPEELAAIALSAGRACRQLLQETPRIAMLSFSTHGSAAHPRVASVRRAAELARERIGDGHVAGELQLDAALVPAVAALKAEGQGEVAGRANVLVFPDLNAGNIAYKAVQYLAGAQAVGPILLGFARPVNDLSRGASVEDIVALTAVTVLQAADG
jgi:phosphate acetyltransferase